LEEIQKNFNISKPMIAGILLILAGVVGIVSWTPFVMGDESLIDFMFQNLGSEMNEEQIKNAFLACGSIGIILSVFAILGGILSFKRKNWKIAIVCSALGLLIIGQLLLSSILCLIATILLFFSKNEFIIK